MERITLGNTVFEGKNNAYLFDGAQTVLVDTGVAVDDTRDQLAAGLEAHGRSFSDLDAVVLTHYHADHTGLAGEIQTASGADVYAHEADAPLIAGDEDAWAAMEATQRELFEQWGMPAEAREELLAFFAAGEEAGIYGADVDVTTFAAGDTLEFDGLELEVLHAPGHTAGLSCFVPRGPTAPGDGTAVLTGDALLPKYTPNVGGADVRVDRPLAAYVETLETLAGRGFDRAWPGHRDPIDEPADRARFILEHHEERAYRVLSALSEDQPADAWTVSARLFGDLEAIHILHGPGEAYAHLEHLLEAGDVERAEGGYRLAAGSADRLESRDDGRWKLSTTGRSV
ncbi:MBL fold metallo-hydrolase [Natrononativus amylolyticus]|uniref:MBL fold metallo-hydrolase n=1 Tax=Natrononativus amylolyticus TaxID=2963434 RepID=UPI0020CF5640|nr:MBL fold metallo-hydrolase [Natrononativus amylolyticus]